MKICENGVCFLLLRRHDVIKPFNHKPWEVGRHPPNNTAIIFCQSEPWFWYVFTCFFPKISDFPVHIPIIQALWCLKSATRRLWRIQGHHWNWEGHQSPQSRTRGPVSPGRIENTNVRKTHIYFTDVKHCKTYFRKRRVFREHLYSFTSLLESNTHTNDMLKLFVVGGNGYNSMTRLGDAHNQKIIKLSLLQTLECLKHLTVTRIAVVDNFRPMACQLNGLHQSCQLRSRGLLPRARPVQNRLFPHNHPFIRDE